jgi:50S ribosomal protein L16 3-hydroxylase
LQASGQRRWQVARSFRPGLVKGTDLRVLEHFEPEQEWVLQAGDMLYLPPGVAHYGLALDLGMTWSIGLRAPSQADLFQELGDWLAEHDSEGQRFTDPDLQPAGRPGEISAAALQGLAELFSVANLKAGALDEFLGNFLSRFRLAHQPAALETPLTRQELYEAQRAGYRISVNPWTRLNWIDLKLPDGVPHDKQARLFAAGHSWHCTIALATLLCSPDVGSMVVEGMRPKEQNCVLDLLNLGHLYLQAPED